MKEDSIPTVVIEPSKGLLDLDLKGLWDYRELLFFLAWRDMKARYAQSIVGIGWAILQPLLVMGLFTLIMSRWANIPSDGLPYPVFALAALLPWGYFAKSVERSSVSVVSEAGLVQKVYFPRLIIPIAATIGGLVDFCIAFVLLLGVMAWYHILPSWRMLTLPFWIGMTLVTALAVSLWLTALHVRYRDVGATIPLFIQLWMFASPIVYPVSMVPEKWRVLYGMNPMVGVIEGFRWAVLGKSSPDLLAITISGTMVALLFLGGVIFFKHMEQSFADVI